jgi:uncharacterized protein
VRDSLIPIKQFVVKVHSRCDLACDHCYVYESPDQSWRSQPMTMSDEVIAQAAQRIADHAADHHVDDVQVVLHGGEPLLVGLSRMRTIISQLHSAMAGKGRLDLRIHTNGVRLNEQFCELFAEYGVKVGISLDGDEAANDRHRRYADGRSSYGHVIRAIGLLQTERFRHLFAGLLCTIDIANDPLAVYSALMALRPPWVDFLLPHATWADPPVRTPGTDSGYADWLIAIFDRWVEDGRPFGVRTFESILSTLTGGQPLTEALGLTPSDLAVIETDGSYEQVDSLKRAFDGAPETGLNVFDHALDLVARHPGIVARQQGLAGLCQTCQVCPVVASCGGGLYTHRYGTAIRYRPELDFANPSVYCSDLFTLITHIEGRLPDVLADRRETMNHTISDTDFRDLATGFGGAGAVSELIKAEESLRRALVAAVYQGGSTSAAVPETARQGLRDAWTVLAAVDQSQPGVLNEVLGHPYVRVWAVRCLEQLRQPVPADGPGAGPRPSPGLARDLGHLGAIAAVAAVRASAPAKVAVPVLDGAVHLPVLGRLVLETEATAEASHPDGGRVAIVVVDGGALGIQVGDHSWTLDIASQENQSPHWEPVRKIRAPGICVAVEDTDPYRDCHQWPAAPRLSDAEFARWDQSFRDAWRTIQTDHAAYAPALAAGLSMLMPLQPGPEGRDISAAARQAFGAVGVARPADPVTLALLLIHEFQHVKLGAILDLYDLFDAGDTRLYHAPWRDDPRPFEGLFQGTYAHLAVSEFWRVRAQAETGTAAAEASQRYERWHAHTRDAIETLAGSGSLTPLGVRFVDYMRHSV